MLRVGLEPVVGKDYNIKALFPKIQAMIEEFLGDQLIAFEKEHIEIPITEIPVFIPRYDNIFMKTETKSKAT